MRKFILILISTSLSLAAVFAHADLGESRLEAKELTKEAQEAGDVDIMITNKQLRASSGSKSRWSLGTALEYSGGSLREPLAEDRPNIAGTTATTDKALLTGSLDVKYNLSTRHSMRAGVGLRWITPLAKNRPRDYDGRRVDVANPFLNYQFIYNFAGMQSVFQVTPLIYTESNLTRLGYAASLVVNQDSVYEFEGTGLSLGFSVWGEYGHFTSRGSVGTPGEPTYIESLEAEQADYIIGFSPLLEYEINETFDLRTVTNLWNFEHMRSQPRFSTFERDQITQSFGLGISVTRNVYVYPNFQFVPEDLRAQMTNVGIAADINVF